MEVYMKTNFLHVLLLLRCAFIFAQNTTPSIVVSPFTTRGQAITNDEAESITDLFITELAKNNVRVVDRDSLDRITREMRFQMTDWSNPQKTAQLGTALNASYLVTGRLNQLGQQISLDLRALDIRTHEIVSSAAKNFNADTIFSNNNDGLFRNIGGLATSIATPVRTKIEQAVQAAQAVERQRQEAERQQQAQRQAQEYAEQQSRYSIVGTWSFNNIRSESNRMVHNDLPWWNLPRDPSGLDNNTYISQDGDPEVFQITFRDDGTFSLKYEANRHHFSSTENFWGQYYGTINGRYTYSPQSRRLQIPSVNISLTRWHQEVKTSRAHPFGLAGTLERGSTASEKLLDINTVITFFEQQDGDLRMRGNFRFRTLENARSNEKMLIKQN